MKLPAIGLLILMGAVFWNFPLAQAQIQNSSISFNTFDGVYNLSRTADGASLLLTEETILADFPANSKFYGISRSIPKTYQSHPVDLKILSVADAAGNQVSYKTRTDKQGNLVVTTGDPAVLLFGPQTFKIRYQTKGVINLNDKTDVFLLNTNGLGWDEPFGTVRATIKIASNLQASLAGDPTCYINTGQSQTNNCTISTEQQSISTSVSSKAFSVPAHQALVIKMKFKPSTFQQYSSSSTKKIIFVAIGLIAVLTTGSYIVLRRRTSS